MSLFPRIQAHAHYPKFLIRIAQIVPSGKSNKVFENWNEYIKRCSRNNWAVDEYGFRKEYFYDDIERSV